MAEQKNTFHLIIATVGEARFDGQVLSATFPGSEGAFEILPHHEPFVATLTKGEVIVWTTNGSYNIPIDGGVLEHSGDHTVVLL